MIGGTALGGYFSSMVATIGLALHRILFLVFPTFTAENFTWRVAKVTFHMRFRREAIVEDVFVRNGKSVTSTGSLCDSVSSGFLSADPRTDAVVLSNIQRVFDLSLLSITGK